MAEEQYPQAGPLTADSEMEYVSGEEYREQLRELTPRNTAPGWRQKVAAVFLALFGISALVLWGLQFRRSLYGDSYRPPSGQTAGVGTEAPDLRNQDTDGDGLSDFEELNLYNTSPYIQDTDSDGASDFDEVKAETDPNCPRGQQCGLGAAPLSPEEGEGTAVGSSPLPAPASGAAIEDFSEDDVSAVLSGSSDAATIRALLKEAGMSDDVLDKFSDEQLISIYQQTLESQQQ